MGIPVRSAQEAFVVIVETSGAPAIFELDTHHDPVFPFILSSFTTEPRATGIEIAWTVTEEQGIIGWRIMRSRDPSRGFAPVSTVLIPGRGDATEPLTYFFLDDSVEANTRYFYYLEGISVHGLAQPSFMVSVTTPRR
jgi:hypothetical protein